MRLFHLKDFLPIIFILFKINIVCLALDEFENFSVRHEIPRNFIESVKSLHEKRKYLDALKSGNLKITEYEIVEGLKNIKNKAQELFSLQNDALSIQFPNVSLPCLTQVALFTEKLTKKDIWALLGRKYVLYYKAVKNIKHILK